MRRLALRFPDATLPSTKSAPCFLIDSVSTPSTSISTLDGFKKRSPLPFFTSDLSLCCDWTGIGMNPRVSACNICILSLVRAALSSSMIITIGRGVRKRLMITALSTISRRRLSGWTGIAVTGLRQMGENRRRQRLRGLGPACSFLGSRLNRKLGRSLTFAGRYTNKPTELVSGQPHRQA